MQEKAAWPACRARGGDAYLIRDKDGIIRCSKCGQILLAQRTDSVKPSLSLATV